MPKKSDSRRGSDGTDPGTATPELGAGTSGFEGLGLGNVAEGKAA